MVAKNKKSSVVAKKQKAAPSEKEEVEVGVADTEKAENPNMVDLGLLDLKRSKVFVNRLPTKTKAVIVNYKNSENLFRISCVIPPHSYIVNVDDDYYHDEDPDDNSSRFVVDSPTLLFTAEYPGTLKPTGEAHLSASYYIYMLNTVQTEQIVVRPYILTNTYSDGRICMGDFIARSILNAFNIYWGSLFNQELSDYSRSMVNDYHPSTLYEHLLNAHTHFFPKLKWQTLTHTVCGKDYWAAPRGAAGVLVTDNAALLKLIPSEFWRFSSSDTPIVVTLANIDASTNRWHFESGNYKFQLAAKNVSTLLKKKSRRDEI